MNQSRCNQTLFWLFLTLQAVVALVAILSIPADVKNAFLFGFSPARLAIILAVLLALFLSAGMALNAWQQRRLSARFFAWIDNHQQTLRIPLAILTLGLGLLLLVAPALFGQFAAYYQRLQPVILWLFTFSLLISVWIAIQHGTGFSSIVDGQKNNQPAKKLFVLALLVMGGLWLFIRVSGIGVTEDVYWNEGSVPLLGLQVWLAIAIGITFAFLNQKFERASHSPAAAARMDLAIFLLIWFTTIAIWTGQPLLRHVVVTEPMPPNYRYYSYSDAATYDAGARYLELGQGINNLRATDKPVYLYFLGILQAITGTSYERVIFGQTLVLALLPAVLYCLGKQQHSRMAGVIAAVLAILLESNAYQATLDVQVSHAKLLLTELPGALLLAILTLLFSRYLQDRENPSQGLWRLTLCGGISALAAFIRPNAYLIIPVLLLILFLQEKPWKARFIRPILFLIGFGLVSLPWFLGVSSGLNVLPKFESITDERYPTEAPQRQQPAPLPVQTATNNERTDPPQNKVIIIANHFLHNLSGAALMFPNQVPFTDLITTVNTPAWEVNWNGALPFSAALLMGLNLAIAGLGFAAGVKPAKRMHWLPLLIFLSYHLANAIVRTSGSRYLVPIQWVVVLYFAIGLAQFIAWAIQWWLKTPLPMQPPAAPGISMAPKASRTRWWFTAAGLLLFGISMPLSDVLVKDVLTPLPKQEAWEELKGLGILEALAQQGWEDEQIEQQILSNETILIYQGRTMTPRFLAAEESFSPPHELYHPAPYSRLTFLGIGPFNAAVQLPLQTPPASFPDNTDVFVIGCADPMQAEWLTRSRSSHRLLIEGVIVAYAHEEQWEFLVSSTFDPASLCP